MPKFHVTAPDGRTVEVTAPEGATEAQAIQYAQDNWETLSKQAIAKPAEPPAQQPPGVTGTDILKNVVGGVVEPVARLATGIVAKPISEVAGLAATGYEALTGSKESADMPQRFAQDVQQRLTYEPRTAAGASEFNPLNAVPELISSAVTGSANLVAKYSPMIMMLPGDENDAASPRGAMMNLVKEAIPQALSVVGGKAAPTIAKAPATVLKAGAKELMQSAIKPTLSDLKSGKASVAIDTMLDKGLSPTKKGVEQIRSQIDDLNRQIAEKIQSSPDKVKTAKLARPVAEKLREFRKQVNPSADISSIKKAWEEFKNHPMVKGGELTVQQAQELKQGTQRQLRKKYGQLGSAEVEAQKALARGLREEISAKVPEVAKLNAEEQRLIQTLNVTERRALMDANKNPMGLALLAHDPVGLAAFMADKSTTFKSLAARMMNRTAKTVESKPSTTAIGAGLVATPSTSQRRKIRQAKVEE